MSGGSSASEGEERVLVATDAHLRDLYRGYEVSLGEGSYPTIIYHLPEDKTWRKRIWPRADFPCRLQRWNIPEEIFSYLISFDCHKRWITWDVPNRPPSGTLLMYDRRKTENYRSDGYDWKTRGKSRTIREDRMKLKVKGFELLYGCYTHSESNVKLHRRSYWLLQNPSIIIIHYLEVEGVKKASSINCPVVSSSQEHPMEELQEGVEPLDLGLLTVGDKNLCYYLSRARDLNHFRQLLHQLSLAVNRTTESLPDISAAVTRNNRLVVPDFALGQASGDKASLPPTPSVATNDASELLLRQAIEMLGVEAVSFMHGHQPLLPKGKPPFVPASFLLKVASHIASATKHRVAGANSQLSPSRGKCCPAQGQGERAPAASSSSLGHAADDLQPLVPLSIESLRKVIPLLDPLEPRPASPGPVNDARRAPAACDFDSEKFCKFVRSLAVMDPLRDVPNGVVNQKLHSNGNGTDGVPGSQKEPAVPPGCFPARGPPEGSEVPDLAPGSLAEQLFMRELLDNQPSSAPLAQFSPSDFLSHYSLSPAHGLTPHHTSTSVPHSESSKSPGHSRQQSPRSHRPRPPIYCPQGPQPVVTPGNSFQNSSSVAPGGGMETRAAAELESGGPVDLPSLGLSLDDDSLMRLLGCPATASPFLCRVSGFEPASSLDNDPGEMGRAGVPDPAVETAPTNWIGGVSDPLAAMFPPDVRTPLHDFDQLFPSKTLPAAMEGERQDVMLTCEESTSEMTDLQAACSGLFHGSIVFPAVGPQGNFSCNEAGMEDPGIVLAPFPPPTGHTPLDHQFANSFLNPPQLVTTGEVTYASSPAQPISIADQTANHNLPGTSPGTVDPMFLSPSAAVAAVADYWNTSSIPSSPSVASVSSLGGAGGGDNFDYSDPPSVVELCELLSESPCVQQEDFRHLSLSDSEQQELVEASRVIQNTLRRHRDRTQLSQEKQAALLLENCYRQCKELKDQRDWAARRIQNQYRLYRRRNQELQRAVLFIQQMYRYQRNRRRSHLRTQPFHFTSPLQIGSAGRNRIL